MPLSISTWTQPSCIEVGTLQTHHTTPNMYCSPGATTWCHASTNKSDIGITGITLQRPRLLWNVMISSKLILYYEKNSSNHDKFYLSALDRPGLPAAKCDTGATLAAGAAARSCLWLRYTEIKSACSAPKIAQKVGFTLPLAPSPSHHYECHHYLWCKKNHPQSWCGRFMAGGNPQGFPEVSTWSSREAITPCNDMVQKRSTGELNGPILNWYTPWNTLHISRNPATLGYIGLCTYPIFIPH